MTSRRKLERKHREEEEATAFAFQEFIQTFQDTAGPPKKTFIKSAILNTKTGQEIGSETNQVYNPRPFIKSNSSLTIKNAIECARILKEPKIGPKGQPKPKSNLELLKDELKLRHLERDRGERSKSCSVDLLSCNDPTTTNLFIANINPKISEQDLIQLFGAYGPLASVKIMWPRTEDKDRSTNCGFVAYMSRRDAEQALLELKDCQDMKVNWGKPVEIPISPIYLPPELLKDLLPPPNTGLPFNAQPINKLFKYPTTDDEITDLLYNSVVKVTIPVDKKVLVVVHRVIEFVVREGPLFEAMIMNREIKNPSYRFLFDNRNSVHVYYRWKLYSLLQGENQKSWSTKEFRMFKGGSIWYPPIVPDYTKGMLKNLINPPVKPEKNMLSDAQMTRFVDMLQTLNVTKKKIGELMVFCLNHVDAVRDIVDIILDSFKNKNTKAAKKIARLYLLSDVLYNSSMKKCYAPVYRIQLQNRLLEIFQQLHLTLANLNHQFDKDSFKRKVLSVLRYWDLWKIYPNSLLTSLENHFLGCHVEKVVEDDSETDQPLNGRSSMKNVSEIAVKKEEKVEKKPPNSFHQLPNFVPSKWEIVDPDQIEAQAMSTKRFHEMNIELQAKEERNKEMSDQERQVLRKIEVIVMQYQDEYESGKRKLKSGRCLENEINSYRKHLLQKLIKQQKSKRKPRPSSSSEDGSEDEWEKKKKCLKMKKLKKHFGSSK